MTTIDTPTQSPRRHPFVRFMNEQGFQTPGHYLRGAAALAMLGAISWEAIKPLVTPAAKLAVSAEVEQDGMAKKGIGGAIIAIQDTRQVKLSPLQRAKVNEAREELRQQAQKLDSVLAEPAP